jgi:hypothetical protein
MALTIGDVGRKAIGTRGILGLLVLAQVVSPGPGLRAEENNIKTPSEIMSEVDASGTELADLFGDLCLTRFPDDKALEEAVGKRQLQPMTQDQVKLVLHEDPGHGWLLKTATGTYVITIENPPYHACAVRRRYAAAPKFETFFQLNLKTWAAANKVGPLRDLPVHRQPVEGGTLTATIHDVLFPNGGVDQTFMSIVTNYSNGQVEVRLVRQIPRR